MADLAAAIGWVWDRRCGTNRNDMACETCAALTELCEELGIEPPVPIPEPDEFELS